MNTPTPRESHVLSLIRRHGPLSRRELHDRTGLRPNTVGEIAGAMLTRGLLREGESESVGVGRPRQLLEIDPHKLNVVGIAFEPGRVSVRPSKEFLPGRGGSDLPGLGFGDEP